MTELIDTCGAMKTELKVVEESDGGARFPGDSIKRRSTEEATNQEFQIKKTKLNNDGNLGRRAKRRGNKNRKRGGRSDVISNDALKFYVF